MYTNYTMPPKKKAAVEAPKDKKIDPSKLPSDAIKKHETFVNEFRDDIELQKTYNIPMNLYTNALSDITWVTKLKDTKENLKRYIYDYKNNSPLTTQSYLTGLGNILKTIDPEKYEPFYQKCFDEGTAIHYKAKEENDSETSEKDRENWIHFPYLKLIQERLTVSRNANRKDRKLNIQHLIMSLVTFTPPVRLDYLTAEIYPPMLNPMNDGKPLKNWFDKISHPMGKKGLNKCYYIYQDKPGKFNIYMHGENKEKTQGKTPEEIERSRFTIDLSVPDISSPRMGLMGRKQKSWSR